MKAQVFERADAAWDWRLRAENGEIIAGSAGQGYTERGDAIEALVAVLREVQGAEGPEYLWPVEVEGGRVSEAQWEALDGVGLTESVA